MAGPKLLPEIGTGLGNRGKGGPRLGFRDDAPIKKPVAPLKPVKEQRKDTLLEDIQAPKFSVNDAIKLRKEIMQAASSGDVDQDQIMEVIQNSGIEDPDAIEAILGSQLTEKAVRYFLKNTKNDPKKAMKLAGKFGY